MKIKFNIGDWSGDGHSHNEVIIVECNYSRDDLQKAYFKSCKQTGFLFHRSYSHDENYVEGLSMLTEYGDGNLPLEFFTEMKERGFDLEELHELESYEGNIFADEVQLVQIILDFCSLNLPKDFEWSFVSDEIPSFNGNWSKISGIGYGMFE